MDREIRKAKKTVDKEFNSLEKQDKKLDAKCDKAEKMAHMKKKGKK